VETCGKYVLKLVMQEHKSMSKDFQKVIE
jgi:hypothetical protein